MMNNVLRAVLFIGCFNLVRLRAAGFLPLLYLNLISEQTDCIPIYTL